MPQLRIVRSLDPVVAFRSSGEEYAVLSTEAALQFGAREQRCELRFAARREQRKAIECAGKHAAIDQLRAAIAEPAGELEPGLFKAAGKAETAARASRRPIGEGLDQHCAEFRFECAWRNRCRQAQIG